MIKKISSLSLALLLLTACQTPVDNSSSMQPSEDAMPAALLDASLWTQPETIQGGEGLSFMIPEKLVYAGGGDTDGFSASWVSYGEDTYFTIQSFVLSKCEREGNNCAINEVVPATPEEVVQQLIDQFHLSETCTDIGIVTVGNAIEGHGFNCVAPVREVVVFSSSKGAYSVTNDTYPLLNDEEMSAGLFDLFLSTMKVE